MTRLAFTRKLPDAVEARATTTYKVLANPTDRPWDSHDWATCLADAVLCTVTDRIDAEIIGKLPECVKLLANFGAGLSHIDLDAAQRRGIVVSNTPDVLTDATADVAMLLLLGAARRAGEGEAMMRSLKWRGWTPTAMLGTHLGGKTLGIYGMGRIGAATASRAAAFGMKIIYAGRQARHDLPFEAEFVGNIEDFWPRCQMVSLHAPLTPQTRGLLSAAVIEALPDGAIIVNTARGELIDDDALVAALASGKVAAAGLDVFTGEPVFDTRYAAQPNTFLLPHLGSATVETRTAMGIRALANIDAFFAGEPVPDRVV